MQITAEQRELADQGEAVRIADPETSAEYVILRSEYFDRVVGLIDDWNPADLRPLLARVMSDDWDDPAMNVYDQDL
jgi:hypothetical protein